MITRGLRSLFLFCGAIGSAWGGTIVSLPNMALPQTFTVAKGDSLEIRFPDATFTIEGDTRMFADPGLTIIDNIIRFVNVDGLGRIFFLTDPATFSTLPPLPSGDTFLNDIHLEPGESFTGTGEVILHEGDPGYQCTVRV